MTDFVSIPDWQAWLAERIQQGWEITDGSHTKEGGFLVLSENGALRGTLFVEVPNDMDVAVHAEFIPARRKRYTIFVGDEAVFVTEDLLALGAVFTRLANEGKAYRLEREVLAD